MYFHGCGKTDAELRAIVERRVAFDVIDNREELERLAALASPGDPVEVMLRLNTGIEAHTHAFVRTGGENTKFGIPVAALPSVLGRIAELPQLGWSVCTRTWARSSPRPRRTSPRWRSSWRRARPRSPWGCRSPS